ncbi:putative F0F1-ATPase subunit (Ca2+/Mg2+ transporter) [Dyadobacter jejuensis]|uniref:Putative F0F1-ATPase subunit (Ca2+/Mg2+ transporter) n=1 Tax=Dyadobacter jejuensis TaxID=1082580 RepID=A0A316ALU5_9BACT|nr:AtpZ/AtpI family protein [Dyadobacter jejuensis]PWJ58229.1 putative F0F1-ATPase subunit (Ca2+/Mg2+ transporter) [Dyadobacter jejuensis]
MQNRIEDKAIYKILKQLYLYFSRTFMEDPSKKYKKNPLQRPQAILKYSGMAMQMLGTILVFTYTGIRLDRWLENPTPWWTLLLSLTGIAASLYLLIRNMPKL